MKIKVAVHEKAISKKRCCVLLRQSAAVLLIGFFLAGIFWRSGGNLCMNATASGCTGMACGSASCCRATADGSRGDMPPMNHKSCCSSVGLSCAAASSAAALYAPPVQKDPPAVRSGRIAAPARDHAPVGFIRELPSILTPLPAPPPDPPPKSFLRAFIPAAV